MGGGAEPLRIAVIHGAVKLGTKKTNARRINEYLSSLLEKNPEVDAVVLPPYPLTGPVIGYYKASMHSRKIRELAERLTVNGGSSGVALLARYASKHGKYIIAGPLIERAGPKVYLTTVVFSPEGDIIAKYRKMTLTRQERRAGISEGKEVVVAEIKGVRIGLFIDEDLAVAEIFRLMQKNDVNIIIGSMLPYYSDFFGSPVPERRGDESYEILTMDRKTIESFLTVRSKEVWVPIVLVGGFVAGGNSSVAHPGIISSVVTGHIAFMYTIPVEPESGVIETKVYGYNDENSHMIIEIDPDANKPREIPSPVAITVKRLCREKLSR